MFAFARRKSFCIHFFLVGGGGDWGGASGMLYAFTFTCVKKENGKKRPKKEMT